MYTVLEIAETKPVSLAIYFQQAHESLCFDHVSPAPPPDAILSAYKRTESPRRISALLHARNATEAIKTAYTPVRPCATTNSDDFRKKI